MGLRYLIEFNVIIYLICFNLRFIVFLFDKKKKIIKLENMNLIYFLF